MKLITIRRKLNNGELGNEGFSLIELIVTIAIMIVFVAVAIISSSVIDSSRVKEVERGIDDFAGMARSKSMSVSAKAWFMEITTDDGDYVTKLCRIDAETVNGKEISEVTVVDIDTYNNKVKVSFTNKSDTYEVNSTNPLRVYFDASTGKISKITWGADINSATSLNLSSGLGRLHIDTEAYSATLKFYYNTGKIERE